MVCCSVFVRLFIAPLIFVQMKRMSKIGPIAPVFVFIKDTWRQSNLPFWQRLKLVAKTYRAISKQ